jgi:hypothetical protein
MATITVNGKDPHRLTTGEKRVMPTVLRTAGFRFFFYSHEGEEPPHIHVERSEAAAKFWLHPDVTLAWSVRFRRRELTRMQQLVEENQVFFLERWDEHFES